METVTIRPANDHDLSALCELYFEFHEFHAQYLPDYLRPLGQPTETERGELNTKIKEIIHGRDATILVADITGQVTGLAEICLKHPDPTNRGVNPTFFAHLQSLTVTRAFRRRGIGMLLLQAAED
jgi:ribosomal protein S18 acetylase RimI-like enzyme